MAILGADGFDLGRLRSLLLFLFNVGQNGAQVLVLCDCGMCHTLLVRIENTTEQDDAFGFQPLCKLASFIQLQVTVVASHSSYSMQLSVFVQNLHFVCESTRLTPKHG